MKSALLKCSILAIISFMAAASTAPNITGQLVYQCHFEDGETCNFTILPYPDGFTWTRFQGSTPSDPTGPDYDHTYLNATGHYMYTEATDFNPGDVAKLQFPTVTFPSSGALCMTFWYNLYGQHIGTLNVSVTQPAQQLYNETVWSLSFNQSYGWFPAYATLRGTQGSTSQVTFVGVRGGNEVGQPFGDIAIDDVLVYENSCGDDPTTTSTTTTPTTTSTTTTTTITTSTTTTTTTSSTTTPTTTTTITTTTTTTTPTTTTTATPTTTTPSVITSQTTTTSSTSTTAATTTTTTTPATTITTTSLTTTPLTSTTTSTTTLPVTTTAATSTTSTAATTTTFTSTLVTTTSTIAATSMSLVNNTTTRFSNTTSVVSGTMLPPDGLVGVNMSTPTMDGQSGNQGSAGQSNGGIWGLSTRDLIIILACLSAAILLLLILITVLVCCLCVTRRRYLVAQASRYDQSESTTIDGISTVDNHPANPRKGHTGHYDVNPHF